MKLSLIVHNGTWHTGSTLYTYEMPDVNVWVPEGGWVQVPFGDSPEDHGVSSYVKRVTLDPLSQSVHVELVDWRTDPPPEQGDRMPKSESFWWTDQDGDLHAGLLAGGWRKYGDQR